jgi:hypothetical protein
MWGKEVRAEFVWGIQRKDTTRKINSIWEDNINMDIKDIVWEGVERIDLAQDRMVCYKHGNEHAVFVLLELTR